MAIRRRKRRTSRTHAYAYGYVRKTTTHKKRRTKKWICRNGK